MKTRLLWSNVIYFQGRDSEIEPAERETIGNISSFIAVPVAESTSNLPLHQTSPIQKIEVNESTDIDVDIIIIIIIMSLFYEDDIFSKQCTNLTYGPL